MSAKPSQTAVDSALVLRRDDGPNSHHLQDNIPRSFSPLAFIGRDDEPESDAPYEYRPLEDNSTHVRFINLLPGAFDDPIVVEMVDEVLPQNFQVSEERTQMDWGEVWDSLPPEMEDRFFLLETHEGRYLFEDRDTDETSWRHPVEGFDDSRYEPTPEHENTFKPAYECLSYVWGFESNPGQIHVAERLPPRDTMGVFHQPELRLLGTLQVTESLATALPYLRRPLEPRKLWIDAICIDQSNFTEREEQVKRMRDIYTHARRVVAWLGPEEENSARAMRALERVGREAVWTLDCVLVRSPECEHPDFWEEEFWWRGSKMPVSDEDLEAIAKLLWRDWFVRLWVVQEIQLADQRGAILQCGHDVLAWSLFRSAVQILCRQFAHLSVNLSQGVAWAEPLTTASPAQRRPMLKVIRTTTGRACSDHRDVIYAALGLLPERLASKVIVDYGPDVSATEVYKRFFLTHISLVERWEILGCNLDDRYHVQGPSWSPDWGGRGRSVLPLFLQASSRGSRLVFSYRAPDLLKVCGLRCATIRRRAPIVWRPPGESLRKREHFANIASWPQLLGDLRSRPYPAGGSLLHALTWTITSGNVFERFGLLEYSKTSSKLETWLSVTQQIFCPKGGDPADESWRPDTELDWETFPEDKQDYADSVLEKAESKGFFVADEGYIGLGPMDTRPGDVVVIVLGCPTPLVLRPQVVGDGDGDGDDSEETFQLVGPCYCYGMHDAIPLLGPIPPPWRGVMEEPDNCPHQWEHVFLNEEDPDNVVRTKEDPRLPPLPDCWEHLTVEEALGRWHSIEEPFDCDFFRNKETGEVVDSDPRMLPGPLDEILGRRGLKLRTFALV